MGNPSRWYEADTEARVLRAQSFGPEAASYDEHRPDYPLAGIRWALEPLRGNPEPAVLDLGAGTGKLTSGLLAVGAAVTAVDPDPAMRAEFTRHHPEVAALSGSAEAIPLPDDSVDAVLVGQALHWFDRERAYPEIARVLRPGGVLAALWNTHDAGVDWVAELDRIARRAEPEPALDDRPAPTHPLFPAFERAYFPHTQRRTAESLTATLGTHSHTLVVTPERRAELLGNILGYLRGRPETAHGEFDFPLRTLVIRAVVS
ncbi:class I SAM-dependent methyltransferase [Nocardia terpenica]|uniref:class I SAM-dependent methyltransferase n=1 Tax=Nocardia terpenica TaxID=455432 RepID=UPI001EEB8967|nr:class I SAM-dependent methyltransferase [Nocardia terpenica]